MPTSGDDDSIGDASSRIRQGQAQQPQRRAKRSRYISIACNECKRRKIKCNGEAPCRRCGHLDLDCVYAPSATQNFKETQEYKHMTSQISTLQQAVESLTSDTSSSASRRQAPNVPYSNADTSVHDSLDSSLAYTPQSRTFHPTKDPIWAIDKEEATRLIRIWENNVHVSLPIINLDRTLQHLDMLHSFLGGARRAGLMMSDLPGADAISDHDTLRLKLMLATALAIEAATDGDLGCSLFANVTKISEHLLFAPVDLDSLELLTLCAICAYYKNDEYLAWRLVGVAGRMLFELGINNHNGFNSVVTRPADRYRATVIVWTIYLLDRRWSVLQCLPPAVSVDSIDHFRPGHDCMFHSVELTELTDALFAHFTLRGYRQLFRHVDGLRQVDLKLVNWYDKLADNIKFNSPSTAKDGEHTLRSSIRLILFLKTNQYRIAVGHPVFLLTSLFHTNLDIATSVVDIARHSIRTIAQFSTCPRFRRNFLLCNHFVLSCIAILYLGVFHAPDQFHVECRDDFHNALELVRYEPIRSFLGQKVLHVLKLLVQIDQLAKQSSISLPGVAEVSDTTEPPQDFSPDLMSSQPPIKVALGITEVQDTVAGLIDDARSIYDQQTPGLVYDFTRQEALTKIFRDLF